MACCIRCNRGIDFILQHRKSLGKSEVAPKMKKMAKQFEKVYKMHPDIGIPATMVVFPFRCDKKLTKKRVNFAVGEILTHYLIGTGRLNAQLVY